MKKLIIAVIAAVSLMACASTKRIPNSLRDQLTEIVNESGLNVGVGLIYQGDTLSINGAGAYPMMSVYKFPLAMAAIHYMDSTGMKLTDSISFATSRLHPTTWSPMRDKLGTGRDSITLTMQEIIDYTVAQSDNNTCEILFDLVGSPRYVQDYLSGIGITDINIASTELEMLEKNELCYANSARPLAAARLLELFDSEIRHSSPAMQILAKIMEQCQTGTDRLPAPLKGTGVVLGHKTGSGFTTPEGLITAHNDIGYFLLPDGRKYELAVFVRDTPLSLNETSAVIARISEAVYQAISTQKKR